jgi:hypothetical protein
MKRIVIVAIAAAAATGCIHVGSESKSEKIETFRLSPPAIEAGAATPRVDALAVSRPRAAPALDTTSIAISRPGQAFDYYEGVRWAESTPAMVQQLLVQSLASAGIYTAVVTAPTRVPFNQLLDVEVRRFEAVSDSDASPPRVVVQLQFTLVDAKRGQRLGSGVATGEGLSPAISWVNVPPGTQSFFLNMRDMDVARNKTSDDQAHWVVWNLPAATTGLPEGVPKGPKLANGAFQFSATGQMYRGPGAGANGPKHHYMFELYALDTMLDVQPAADAFESRANVMKAIQGHILGKAVYGGLFRRPQ